MSDSTTQPADTSMEMNEELDATVEEEINHDATQVDNMNVDGAADAQPATNGDAGVPQAVQEARIPAKKDATLREFLGKMDEFAPIVCSSMLTLYEKMMLNAYRSPTQLPTTTSHAPACHRHRTPRPTSPAYLRLRRRSSLPTLRPTHTSSRASDRPTPQVTIPWVA
jgi:hypothetical protein